jgi:hypothetical protein
MGEADFLRLGDWNVQCFRCGRKRKASSMRKQWQGYYVCPAHWEPRQPQDFVRGVPDRMTPPWTQPPPADIFVDFCTPDGVSAIPDYAQPDCCIPDYLSPSAIGPFLP